MPSQKMEFPWIRRFLAQHTNEDKPVPAGVGNFYEIISQCGLSKRQEQVLSMKFCMNMSLGAIAEQLNIARRTAQFYYEAGLDKVRKFLQDPYNE